MRIPQKSPDWQSLVDGLTKQPASDAANNIWMKIVSPSVRAFVQRANEGYSHWDHVRMQSVPEGLTHETAWLAIQLSRSPQRQNLPIEFNGYQQLHYWLPPSHIELISSIDKRAGAYVATRHNNAIPDDNERYLVNSLMEEAIASSQIEGAATTREVAKEMLRSERRPRDKGEQMILNNYNAILEIRERKADALTPELLLNLHSVLTENTLDDPGEGGRFRLPGENINVIDFRTNEVIHTPPPAKEIAGRIQSICEFANQKSKPYVHPLVKAIALHFAIGFVHPFVDGNGRTARALFYWYMLKSGYWMFEFLPISRIIKSAPAKYTRAYLYTEHDNGDLAYFNNYHLRVVERAINDLQEYLEQQQALVQEACDLLENFPELNYRQRVVVQNSIKHPLKKTTAREHQGKFQKTYNTARADLDHLVRLGLLVKKEQAKGRVELSYMPSPDIMKKLKASCNRKIRKRIKHDPVPDRFLQGGLFDSLFE